MTGQHVPGNETITYPISGSVSAPSATIDTVDIFVDGEYHDTINVSTTHTPGIPEQFETELELATTEATVTVVAHDDSVHQEINYEYQAGSADIETPEWVEEIRANQTDQ